MKGKTLTTGERKIVINVIYYFKIENSLLQRNSLVEMTVKATRASATYVKIIVLEEDANKSLCKNRPKRKKAFNRLDEFDLGVIRHMTYSFYARGKSPRLAKLY